MTNTRVKISSEPVARLPMRKWRFPDRQGIVSLSQAESKAFKAGQYIAVYLAGATEIVPRYLGDTVGVTPFFIGRSQSWKDTVSATLDRYSATYAHAIVFRLWVATSEVAKFLEAEISLYLSPQVRKLRGNALDLGPNPQLCQLRFDIMTLVEGLGIHTLDDEQMLAQLRRLTRAARPSA